MTGYACQASQRGFQRVNAGGAVLGAGELFRRVRDARGVANVEHGGRHGRREHGGVVAGAGRQGGNAAQRLGDGHPRAVGKAHGAGPRLLGQLGRAPLFGGVSRGCCADIGDERAGDLVVLGAAVQPHVDVARDDVSAARGGIDAADGGAGAGPGPRQSGNLRDRRARGDHGVAPVGHEGGAGVVSLTGEAQPPAAVAEDTGGHADGDAKVDQPAALLHVQLEEQADARQQRIVAAGAGRVESGSRHHLGQRASRVIGQRQRRYWRRVRPPAASSRGRRRRSASPPPRRTPRPRPDGMAGSR